LTFQGQVTSSLRDHSVAHMSFPIGGPLEPGLYLLTVFEIFNVKCKAVVNR